MRSGELENIYRTYYREVYLYALSLTRNPVLAEELTSDTFYKALLTVDMAGAPVRFWLLRVCKNLYIDTLRRHKRAKQVPLAESLAAEGDFLGRLIQEETTRRLYTCLLRLPEADRELLYMFYFYNHSTAGIARLLGKSPGAVKTALSRARTRLKALIEEEE